jgi:hypothetical protein
VDFYSKFDNDKKSCTVKNINNNYISSYLYACKLKIFTNKMVKRSMITAQLLSLTREITYDQINTTRFS